MSKGITFPTTQPATHVTHYHTNAVAAAPSQKLVLHPRKFKSTDTAIHDALEAHNIHNSIFLDGEYRVLPESEMLALAKATHTSAQTYIPTFYDCDDFAFTFKGLVALMAQVNSVGLFLNYAGKHAYNVAFVMPSDKTPEHVELRIIEPQSDTEVAFGSSPPYTIEHGEYTCIF